ncbi:MAG: class I SAM-dependent methyltransferase [Vallitalea sp.]|jgi:ubiquinone/menaquinone biosynthesis C-methylase UbiE|nr:class I SAM-dependent methyltransferase [Vallitalea sp.]
MSSYNSFAMVYDKFMSNVPYEMWTDYIIDLIHKYYIKEPKLMLDLGCGTGNITRLLANKCYDMIGIDNSYEMLSVAKEKSKDTDGDILYLLQDMREFELYGTVDCIVSICDSINYILEEQDLLQVFKLVNNYLDPKGLFIFDLNTCYKYKNILNDNTFAETNDESAYIWDNYYYEEESINEYDLTLFIKDSNNSYHRYSETHHQRMYELSIIKKLLHEAGLEFVDCFNAFTFEEPNSMSERVYFIARENGK